MRRRFLFIALTVVGLLLVSLLAVNLLISSDAVRDRVAARVKEQTGRELTVKGSSTLLLLPSPHISLTEVEVRDPSGRAGGDLKIGKVSLDVTFGELFSRDIDAQRVVLERPVLTLRLKDQGNRAERPGKKEERRAALKPRFAAAQADGGGRKRHDVMLKDVRIVDGTVRIIYDDAGAERRIERIDAILSLPNLNDTLDAKGEADWKGARVGFDLDLTSPADLEAERAARLSLALDTEAIDASFNGQIATRPDFSAQGQLTGKTRSVPSVLAWIRRDRLAESAMGTGEFSTHVNWENDEISFSALQFDFSHATGQAQAVLSLKSPRPHLRAALAIENLHLDPELWKDKRTQRAAAAEPSETGAVARKDARMRPSPEAPAAQTSDTERPEWFAKPDGAFEEEAKDAPPPSSTPPPRERNMNLDDGPSAAAGFDADINVNVRQTKLARLVIGPSSLSVTLRDGLLDSDLTSMQLYDGSGTGKLKLNAAKPVPSFAGNFVFEDIDIQPLLAAAADFKLISGRGDAEIELSGTGDTEAEIKHSLAGGGSFAIDEGAIEGINLTELIESLGAGNIPEIEQGPGARTEFSEFSGTFTMASGVAETHDIEIESPLLKVTARGTVDVVTGTIDFLTHPKIVEGKKGKNALAGLTIPIRIEGPFSQPAFRPEIKGLFASPGDASRTVNQIGEMLQEKLKGRPVGEALGRFLGNVRIGTDRDRSGPGGQDEAPSPAERAEPSASQSNQSGDPELDDILR